MNQGMSKWSKRQKKLLLKLTREWDDLEEAKEETKQDKLDWL